MTQEMADESSGELSAGNQNADFDGSNDVSLDFVDRDQLGPIQELNDYSMMQAVDWMPTILAAAGGGSIPDDPIESNNLFKKEPTILKKMKERLDVYKKSIVPPLSNKADPASNPNNYNGYWTPGWC